MYLLNLTILLMNRKLARIRPVKYIELSCPLNVVF